MRYPRIAAGDRREVRTARTIVGSVTHRGTCHGRRPDREADRTERGYQYRGARGGGGFSARGAAETITATPQDGARGDGRQLAGVLAEDLTGRGTDLASGRSAARRGSTPRSGSSARSSGRSSGRATAGTRSSWNTTACDLRLCAATTRASMARASSGSWQCAQASYGSAGCPQSRWTTSSRLQLSINRPQDRVEPGGGALTVDSGGQGTRLVVEPPLGPSRGS